MTTTPHTPRRVQRDAATICPAVSGSARCELDAGHEGLHKDECAHWPDPAPASSGLAHTPRRDDLLAVIPDGYYALPDPDLPDTMTYWRRQRTGRAFTAWPANAKYGPLVYRKDRPKDHAAAVDWMRAHNELRRAWHERVLAAIAADPATAAARFAELTTRCLCCGRKLTDAKSKLLGIGPDCRRRARLDDAVLCAHVTPRIAAAHAVHAAETAASSSGSGAGAREDGAR